MWSVEIVQPKSRAIIYFIKIMWWVTYRFGYKFFANDKTAHPFSHELIQSPGSADTHTLSNSRNIIWKTVHYTRHIPLARTSQGLRQTQSQFGIAMQNTWVKTAWIPSIYCCCCCVFLFSAHKKKPSKLLYNQLTYIYPICMALKSFPSIYTPGQ